MKSCKTNESNRLIKMRFMAGECALDAIKEFIFKEGVSSKGEGRGTGLFLVKSRVELYNGHIEIEEFNDEKIFVVIIYKGE